MNNQRFRPQIWRLRLSLWFARLRVRGQTWADQWRVPSVSTSRWFVLAVYFLVVLLVGLAWFGRPTMRWDAKLPGDSPGYPFSFFGNPSEDIAPPYNQPITDTEPSLAAPSGWPDTPLDDGDNPAMPVVEPAAESPAEVSPIEPAGSQPTQGVPDRNPPPAPAGQQNDALFAGGETPVLHYPLAGDVSITNPYALVARQGTLNDWRSHQAVDLAGEIGSVVRAAAAGTVKQILQNDILWGTVLVLDHGGGYTSSYSSLQDLTVRVGQSVAAGQTIGKLAGSPPVEQMEMAHLHFVFSDGEQAIDPIGLFR